jgi:predicted transcriptional regulator
MTKRLELVKQALKASKKQTIIKDQQQANEMVYQLNNDFMDYVVNDKPMKHTERKNSNGFKWYASLKALNNTIIELKQAGKNINNIVSNNSLLCSIESAIVTTLEIDELLLEDYLENEYQLLCELSESFQTSVLDVLVNDNYVIKIETQVNNKTVYELTEKGLNLIDQ